LTSSQQCVKVCLNMTVRRNIAVRRARPGDWLAIDALNRSARRKLPLLWWWEEHLGDDLFVLVEQEGLVVGSLFVWPDESPVAWVRSAGLDDALDVDDWLDLTLPAVLDRLRDRGARKLAWMDYNGWAGPHLETHGFQVLTDVITLAKFDRALPSASAAGIHIRPVSSADISAVAAVDQAAFTPHWWHSATTIRRRAAAASCFVIAKTENEVVGYAEGESHPPSAHLNRIAVHPAHQGHGIGTLLLADAVRTFWQSGAERVTLNTQNDNHHSQQLYCRFGFEPTGHVTTAWELQL
jgi:ribosomal protein S18 acetylase RimI-like enzyme